MPVHTQYTEEHQALRYYTIETKPKIRMYSDSTNLPQAAILNVVEFHDKITSAGLPYLVKILLNHDRVITSGKFLVRQI